ncbi:MAG: hypothetical protein ABIG68_02530, partial [Acidobacteriota bacterium]
LLSAPRAVALHTKLHSAALEMEKLVFQPIEKWQMSPDMTKEEALDMGTKKKFRRVGIGYFWADAETLWLRTRYEVPERILNTPVAGSKIQLSVNIEDYFEIYVNGELLQQARRSTGRVTLTESANPGDRFFIVIMAQRKSNDTGLIRNTMLEYDIFDDLALRALGYAGSFEALGVLFELTDEDPEKWKPVLDRAGEAIDIDALRDGRFDDFYASLDRSDEILKPLTDIFQRYSMLLVGYSHIDPAWMWDRAEGEHIVVKGTSEKVLELQEEFPGWVYAMNQMHCFRWMEQDYPELFERMKDAVLRGAWEPVGAEWVEPDGNLPGGEAFVRQFLYGRKYSIDKFGFASTIGWTPDSFGYNWNLPQILKKCDMRGFVTQKIGWSDTTRFPHNLFWWESPDGSRVLVYFPQGSYGESVISTKMATELRKMKEKHGVDSNLVIFGIGDHGGGIPRDYAQRAFGLAKSPIFPKIEFTSMERVFDRMLEKDKELHFPTWKDELYLEYHRGTYTSQARTKNNNRRNEIALANAEKFSSIASMVHDTEYEFDRIEEAWKILLFNQFHDILPGSSINPVYRDADADHAWVAAEAKEITDAVLNRLANMSFTLGPGDSYVIFNPSSWQRQGLVEIDLAPGVTEAAVFNEVDEPVPAQIIYKPGGNRSVLFVARSVPGIGYAVYRVVPDQ